MTHYEKSHCVAGVHQEFFNNMVRSFCPGWFGEGAGLSETNCSEERVDLNFPPPDGRATYSTRRKFIYRVNNQRELERIANPTFREEAAAKTF
uniref:Uncharacterized protein n=1 Tax=Caenorhabditis japonica TaxID=281687 RepID=A0A8R1IZX9_CAEJA